MKQGLGEEITGVRIPRIVVDVPLRQILGSIRQASECPHSTDSDHPICTTGVSFVLGFALALAFRAGTVRRGQYEGIGLALTRNAEVLAAAGYFSAGVTADDRPVLLVNEHCSEGQVAAKLLSERGARYLLIDAGVDEPELQLNGTWYRGLASIKNVLKRFEK